MELFEDDRIDSSMPLARRMRPRNLAEFCGQEHIIGKGKVLQRAVEADKLCSLILYGPPGSGKTTLASCISGETRAHFSRLNAVTSGVGDLRKLIDEAVNRRRISGRRTIVFVDEIHRFNKMQQDALMPDVEEGNIILIGATVMNPFFSIIPPLLSRSLVFSLEPLSEGDIKKILAGALSDRDRGLGGFKVDVPEDVLDFIAENSAGDARKALNALELGVLSTGPSDDGTVCLNVDSAREAMQGRHVIYDRDGDGHYDTISAFIKSMRGSDPDAAVYWLAKMLSAGEDPLFAARRILICASEDVGNADPMALVVASAAFKSVEVLGLPEGRIPLAQAAIYVACAPKSNASYNAINKAMEDIENKKIIPVPKHLKDTAYKGARRLGHGDGYKYPHDFPGHYVEQTYAGGVKGRYYRPDGQGLEKEFMERLNEHRKRSAQEKDAGTAKGGSSGRNSA